jgi:hypothetical protein
VLTIRLYISSIKPVQGIFLDAKAMIEGLRLLGTWAQNKKNAAAGWPLASAAASRR